MAGLLDTIKQKMRGLLEPTRVPDPFDVQANALQSLLGPSDILPNAVGRITGSPVAEFAAGFLSPTQMLKKPMRTDMTVYHGSPHKFDKFDSSKIGTGEGAQAYGHGLYMAESPAVAANYRNVLSDTLEVKGAAQPLEKRAAQMALTFGDNTTEGALQWLSKFEGRGANHVSPAMTPELVKQVKQKFQDGTFSQGGALYKVDLPDTAISKMLDWDKPLSEQHPDVQAALMPYLSESTDLTKAQGVYGLMAARNMLGDDVAVASALKQAGIPGIRYLDGGSRAAGNGTSNFVLFDDQLPRILERNGVPTGLKPWLPGEWGGL